MSSEQTPQTSSKRQHIVETAYRLFTQDGFHATGIDRIIAEAQVAKMTMYRHFPSKEGLIVEVLDERFRRFEEQLDRMAALSKQPEGMIDDIIEWYGRWFNRADFNGCLFAHALAEYGSPGHPVFDAAVRQKESLRRRIVDILAKQRMSSAEAETASTAILMLIEGATLMAEMGQGGKAIDAARRAVSDIIAAGGRT
ncbi:AcrR family transcriptional regulator [Neorhizobium galegae]|uniref:TetR/AcrR family transcriptional regulator n=1 Tax=Neorhizobium galegae TaxID=399 RepID=UPI0027843798|nr:TetR/AcrR family transcriptional regulator [Neorhizobium galegae]MDQ0135101.1 AcrR family transcriptional regulator [Neorhizobium galegae]